MLPQEITIDIRQGVDWNGKCLNFAREVGFLACFCAGAGFQRELRRKLIEFDRFDELLAIQVMLLQCF